MKIHASATGSRSGLTTPSAWPCRITSAKKSWTSRTWPRTALAMTSSSDASVSAWIHRSTRRSRDRFAM